MTQAEQIHQQGLEIQRLEQMCQALRNGLQEVRELCRAAVELVQVSSITPAPRSRRTKGRTR